MAPTLVYSNPSRQAKAIADACFNDPRSMYLRRPEEIRAFAKQLRAAQEGRTAQELEELAIMLALRVERPRHAGHGFSLR